MATPSNFQITPFGGLVRNTEFSFRNLHLHHIYSGPNPNQSNIIAPNSTTGLGTITVNNWPVYDGVGPDKKLVARAQGLHVLAGKLHNSFSIVFEDERFKASTLEVMGAHVDKEGEWAIVGGTGEFAMACGVIKRRVHEQSVDADIIELTISGLCTMKSLPAPTKNGPWGGNAGSEREVKQKPLRLESVTVRSEGLEVIDQSGQRQTEGPWGAGGPAGATTHTIVLGPSEFVKEVSGVYGDQFNITLVKSLVIVTNVKSYIPFGNPDHGGVAGTPFRFTADVEKNSSIVGFFGRSDQFLNSIGVYTV
ncbi:hypothetical protein ACQ4PT_029186 [Festuca glaucescens]